uniref:Uncharacterized protein n=1 Tax=Avena sativa TaxID=4498 RepID=A0ACD5XYJ8_AVESA
MGEIMAAWSSEQGGGDGGGLFLPPGFRFHPEDEEIITSYLLRKFLNPSFAAIAVGEVDLNSCEPRDLPSKATMGEKEWYFFVHKDLKYPTGSRANRATREGYWKATGKDREIFKPSADGDELVGMKKTLVFYTGRAPRGAKSDWVMHEFRLEGKSRNQTMNNPKDEWVVCKVFNKKGEAKTTTKTTAAAAADTAADVESSYSAVTTPNASSVEVEGEPDADFIDSIFTIDPLYFTNSDEYTGNQMPAKETTITNNTNTNAAAPPYNADFYYSVPTTAGTFNAMPNYSLTNNAPSNMQMQAVAADTMASSVQAIRGDSDLGSSCQQYMLTTPPHGMGKRSYDGNLREQQAMMRALEGVIDSTNFAAPATDLPSTSVPPQKMMKLGSYDVVDGEFPYGNYAAATMNGQVSAAKNFGALPY